MKLWGALGLALAESSCEPAKMSLVQTLQLTRRPALGFVAIGVTWGAFAASMPDIKAHLGASDARMGTLLLAMPCGLVFAMLLAPMADRRLGAYGMRVSAMLLGPIFLVPIFAGTQAGFAMGMVLVGATTGLTDVLMNTRVTELEARHNRPLMNLNHGIFSVAYAVSALATGALREAGYGPTTVFSCTAVILVLLSLGMTMAIEQHDEATKRAHGIPWGLVALGGCVVLIAFMSEATVEGWSALHIERTLGGRAAEGAMGPAMLGMTMALGRFSGQWVAGRFHEMALVLGAGCVAVAGLLLAATATAPVMGYIGFGVFGLGVSVIGPMGLAVAGRLAPAGRRTDVVAKVALVAFVGFFLGPAYIGYVSEFAGLRLAFASVSVLFVILVPVALSLWRMERRKRALLAA